MVLNTNKAYQRFRLAFQALEELKNVKTFQDFEDCWLQFLLHANGVYVQLEQAAKVSSHTKEWFGIKKRERKEDELMQYIHQARNSDEHTIEKVTALNPGHTAIGKSAPGYSSSMIFNTLPDGSLNVKSMDGKPVLIEVKTPTIELRPVIGRGHVVFNPPSLHRGNPLPDNSPLIIAELAIQFLSELLAEADGLTS